LLHEDIHRSGASRILLILSLFTGGFVCKTVSSVEAVPPRTAIRNVNNLAVQFSGTYNTDIFSRFDVVFIDPDVSQDSEVDTLLNHGVLPIAYLNIGEAETYRWYYSDIQPGWLFGKNPNWPDHYYIDVNNAEWQQLILERILPRIFRKNFAGVFLDMVDVASPDLHPSTREGVIALIGRIRRAYPQKAIIMNDGTFLVDQVSSSIDGLCVESVFASYDFKSKKYYVRTKSEADERCKELTGIAKRFGTRIFLIDYAAPDAVATKLSVMAQARQYGFVPFVGTINLDSIR
jgi:polysaccharide biosynthesis protein PelA